MSDRVSYSRGSDVFNIEALLTLIKNYLYYTNDSKSAADLLKMLTTYVDEIKDILDVPGLTNANVLNSIDNLIDHIHDDVDSSATSLSTIETLLALSGGKTISELLSDLSILLSTIDVNTDNLESLITTIDDTLDNIKSNTDPVGGKTIAELLSDTNTSLSGEISINFGAGVVAALTAALVVALTGLEVEPKIEGVSQYSYDDQVESIGIAAVAGNGDSTASTAKLGIGVLLGARNPSDGKSVFLRSQQLGSSSEHALSTVNYVNFNLESDSDDDTSVGSGLSNSYTIPDGEIWEIQVMRLVLDTSAAVANRTITLIFERDGVTMWYEYISVSMIASTSYSIYLAKGHDEVTTFDALNAMYRRLPEVYFDENWTITVTVNNDQTGDRIRSWIYHNTIEDI
jgi:hypothetical protein